MAEKRFADNGLVLEADYAHTMAEAVEPWLREHRQDREIKGHEGKPLFTSRYAAAQSPVRGTVLLVHGFTETGDKFAELIWSLTHQGYDVISYDHRGHGRSWREESITDLSLTHVAHFGDYVADMRCVVAQVLYGLPRPWLLYAHSMGGAVSALYLEQYPDDFDRAVLSSPMIAPHRGGMSLGLSKAICINAKLIGRGKKRIIMSRPYAGPEDFATSAATSRARFDWYDQIKQQQPQYQNNGPTFTWTLEALNVTDAILADGAPERIACPVLLYTAEEDNSVLPEPQERFINRVPKGQHRTIKGARHEIYRSTDEVLLPWWDEVLAFFSGEAQ